MNHWVQKYIQTNVSFKECLILTHILALQCTLHYEHCKNQKQSKTHSHIVVILQQSLSWIAYLTTHLQLFVLFTAIL